MHAGVPGNRTRQPAGRGRTRGRSSLPAHAHAHISASLVWPFFVSSDDELAAVNAILSVEQKFSTFDEFETALKLQYFNQ